MPQKSNFLLVSLDPGTGKFQAVQKKKVFGLFLGGTDVFFTFFVH